MAQRVVELRHDGCRDPSEERSDPLDGDRADLLGLSLRVLAQTGRCRAQQCLEREDPVGVAGDRHDRHHPAAESCRGRIGVVVADHHCRPSRVGLAAARRVEIDEPDLTALHRPARRQRSISTPRGHPMLPTRPRQPRSRSPARGGGACPRRGAARPTWRVARRCGRSGGPAGGGPDHPWRRAADRSLSGLCRSHVGVRRGVPAREVPRLRSRTRCGSRRCELSTRQRR
jgi:hypothetical protein